MNDDHSLNKDDSVLKNQSSNTGNSLKLGRLKSGRQIIIVLAIIFILSATIFGLLNWMHKDQNKVADFNLGYLVSQNVLDASSLQEDVREVKSSFGFSLSYDKKMFDGQGQVTDASSDENYVSGMTYTEDDLDVEREYSLVKLRPLKTEVEKQNESDGLVYLPELTVLTNIRQSFWDNKLNDPAFAGKSKLQIFIDSAFEDTEEDGYETTLSNPEVINLNGTDFTKVIQTQTTNTYGLGNKYQNVYYFAVNNDRPYQITIYNTQRDTRDIVAQIERVISTIVLGDVDTAELSYSGPGSADSSVLSADTSQSAPKDSANVVNDLDEDNILDIVVRNQLSVVRVGTVLCIDVDLLAFNNTAAILKDVCMAAMGSGSIISTDGLIATNGHVVSSNNTTIMSNYLNNSSSVDHLADKVAQFMPYFISIGDLSSAQSNSFLSAIRSKDKNAMNLALSLPSLIHSDDIRVTSTRDTYALQLSNEPMRLIELTSPEKGFQYTKSVISADFLDKDFDSSEDISYVRFADLKGSDVALLRADGMSFPTVKLGSILGIGLGDRITAIGFPVFVDEGLITTRTTTVPSVSQGKLLAVMTQSYDPNRLLMTDVPISSGNSGGPAFDSAGNQIGLNTYSAMDCPDTRCFGNGTARDIEDIRTLLKRSSLQLSSIGKTNEDWNQGIDAFKAGNYRKATDKFAAVKSNYADHYLASGMYDIANDLAGSVIASVVPSTAANKALVSIILAAVVLGVIGFTYLLLRRNGHKLSHPHTTALVANDLANQHQLPVVSQPIEPVASQVDNTQSAPVVQPVQSAPLVVRDGSVVRQPIPNSVNLQPSIPVIGLESVSPQINTTESKDRQNANSSSTDNR